LEYGLWSGVEDLLYIGFDLKHTFLLLGVRN